MGRRRPCPGGAVPSSGAVSDSENPREILHARCNGNQGELVVWHDIVVPSRNSPAGEAAECDGHEVPEGFEGLHVWDISNLAQPELIAAVERPCGSHTATAVRDPENDRLLVYNQAAGGPCFLMDIVSVPLDDPAAAELIWEEAFGAPRAAANRRDSPPTTWRHPARGCRCPPEDPPFRR